MIPWHRTVTVSLVLQRRVFIIIISSSSVQEEEAQAIDILHGDDVKSLSHRLNPSRQRWDDGHVGMYYSNLVVRRVILLYNVFCSFFLHFCITIFSCQELLPF
jgi:hypothetical protein